MCACVCVRACACVFVCMCVCVWCCWLGVKCEGVVVCIYSTCLFLFSFFHSSSSDFHDFVVVVVDNVQCGEFVIHVRVIEFQKRDFFYLQQAHFRISCPIALTQRWLCCRLPRSLTPAC